VTIETVGSAPAALPHDVAELIRTKRDGGRLAVAAIKWVINAYTRGAVPDEQMSALLMAIFFRGLDAAELAAWMGAMIESGERLDLSGVGRPTVDKHSTGGVGDKVSLVLAPLVAACGAGVPQLSGRGLGHTGGTLDKLEAIAGWRADLAPDEMVAVLASVGCVICGAGPGLAPADRKLYALRDVTGTVESIPLIASSIMSKKIAEGTSALVLDVKVGSGAFMKNLPEARQLAETMVALGPSYGVKTAALLTRMDEPLGRACGNAVEVRESVEVLRGGGPADVVEVTLALAREMLDLVGLGGGRAGGDGGPDPASVLAGGGALGTYESMIRAQGGDPAAPMPEAPLRQVVEADRAGYVRRLDAMGIGTAAWRLGAGRARKEDPVSAGAGVICLRKSGEPVEEGEPVLELLAEEEGRFPRAREALVGAIEIGPEPPERLPMVIEAIR
jgi:thymidine phosphorylase